MPESFELLIIFFIYSAIYLGEVRDFYFRFWWWDTFLHFISAMALGIIGFAILLMLRKKEKISAKPFWISLFVFSFALSMGALWEIFEFAVDQIFGTNMQKSGLVDTMKDLIVDSIGALVVATTSYFYLKRKKETYPTKIAKQIAKQIE